VLTDTPVTVIQLTLEMAVQEQPPLFVTEIEPDPPLELSERLVELNAMLQPPAPLWVTVTTCPATTSVPVRMEELVLLDAVNATAPEPVPPEPTPGVSQASFDVTDQAHPLPAKTVADAVPPLDDMDSVMGDTL
jgi:hypothetical protein